MIALFGRRPTDKSVVGDAQPKHGSGRSTRLESLHLFVLATFAVVQPVYDRLGDRPAFLNDSGVGVRALLIVTALTSIVLPAIPVLLYWLAGRIHSVAQTALHSILLFLLLLIIALPACKRIEGYISIPAFFGMALAMAAVSVWAYDRYHRLRSTVTVAAAGIVLFPAQFLLHSPVSSLLFDPPRIQTTNWKPIPIVMVVLDEVRGLTLTNAEHQIDSERFPNFAELARESTWFRNATTVFADTWQAVPAILSGKYPTTPVIPTPSVIPQNLFSVLESTGSYDFAVFEPVTRLASYQMEHNPRRNASLREQIASIVPTLGKVFLVHLAPTELQERLPEVPRLWFGLVDESPADRSRHRGVFRYPWGIDRSAQIEHFVECLDDAPKPALYFFHVLLPHVPWCYLPSGRKYLRESNEWEMLSFNTHGGTPNFWGTDELYVTHGQQRHLLQLSFADRMIGRILSRLREVGLYDRCLLIVTADHGISFQTGTDRRIAIPPNLADIVSVPLFIKLPGQTVGAVSDRNVESIDILPTIADVLDGSLQFPVDGRSVFDGTLAERTDKTIVNPSLEHITLPSSIVQNSKAADELRLRFGPETDPNRVYRIGPDPELLDRQVSDLATGQGPQVDLDLIRGGTSYSSDPDELVPSYQEGRVASMPAGAEPVRIAVAVNGIVRGVTRTYKLDGLRDHWLVIIPENAFQVGDNDVQYYSVTGTAPDLRLQRCRVRNVPQPVTERKP
jgi:Sulfatase